MKNIITETVRYLRNNPTHAEKSLWKHIKGRQLGKRFVRQKPIKFSIYGHTTFIIADFYCGEIGLIIEINGEIHAHRKEQDDSRDWTAEAYGYKTLRFSNDEVLNNIQYVLQKILTAINQM